MVSSAVHAFSYHASNVIRPHNIPSGPTKTWLVFSNCIFSCTEIRRVHETKVWPRVTYNPRNHFQSYREIAQSGAFSQILSRIARKMDDLLRGVTMDTHACMQSSHAA